MDTNIQLNNWNDFREDMNALDNNKNQEDLEFLNQPLTPLFFHEALDRTALAGKFVSDMLSDHPVYHQHPELNRKLDRVLELLADMYQEIPNLPTYSYHEL
jgi:hypothetical protein